LNNKINNKITADNSTNYLNPEKVDGQQLNIASDFQFYRIERFRPKNAKQKKIIGNRLKYGPQSNDTF